MSALGYPTCPACGEKPARSSLFCPACFAGIPAGMRRELDRTWKALRSRPGSKRIRADYDDAVAAAVGAVT